MARCRTTSARFMTAQRGVYDGALRGSVTVARPATGLWFIFRSSPGSGAARCRATTGSRRSRRRARTLAHPLLGGAPDRMRRRPLATDRAERPPRSSASVDAMKVRSSRGALSSDAAARRAGLRLGPRALLRRRRRRRDDRASGLSRPGAPYRRHAQPVPFGPGGGGARGPRWGVPAPGAREAPTPTLHSSQQMNRTQMKVTEG